MNGSSTMTGHATDELVGQITDEFLERLDRGECPEVEDYARRYPEVAAVIRRVFPALQLMRGPQVEHEPAERWSELGPPTGCLGDFRILREIGRGGMGVVYEAEQISLGRHVALKVLPFVAALDTRQSQRFRLEAQAAACLHHTNIVPVHAVGCERGVHFYAMQHIQGASLAQLIAELRRLDGLGGTMDSTTAQGDGSVWSLVGSLATGLFAEPGGLPVDPGAIDAEAAPDPGRSVLDRPRPDRAAGRPAASMTRSREYIRTVARFGVQAAEALHHAHTRGIHHRDIKPANLMLDAQGHLWVTDFGLAQFQDNPGLTMTGDVLGTLRYMSPEQALGGRVVVDGRTDIYSLGVTLYELLTLRPALDGRNRASLLRQIAQEDPRPPRCINASVPRDLETILQKAMAKEPDGRYATASDLADELRRFLEHRPIVARRPGPFELAAKWVRRHRPVLAAGAAGLVLALAVLAGSLGWILRDHAARSEVIEREARLALDEATELEALARWPEALGATKRAEGFLASGGRDLLRRRARELRRDLEMALRLEEIRLPQGLSGPDGARDDLWSDAAYSCAFREFGIAVEALEPKEAAARIRARTIRVELALALDHWADRRKKVRGADHPDWRRFVELAHAVDPDARRDRVRKALANRDAPVLAEIAAGTEVIDLPAPTLSLLVQDLDAATGEAVLRRAQRKHPDDFWLNFQLAWDLDHLPRPRLDEAVRYYTVATALRPGNGPTHLYLAGALARLGKGDEAIVEYRRAIECKPDSALALNDLAWDLATVPDPGLRDPAQAVELARKAVGLAPSHGAYWNTLGVALYRAGDWRGAIEALERSAELRRGDSFDWFFLAMARWQLGERDEAARLYERAVAWMVKHNPNDEELRRFRHEAGKLLGARDRVP